MVHSISRHRTYSAQATRGTSCEPTLFDKLKKQFHPIFNTLTVSTRNCSGTSAKFTSCRNGHTVQFAFSAGQYDLSNFSLRLPPSKTDMLDRKTPIMVGANSNWSAATRPTTVRCAEGRLIRLCRTWNHFVARGPKTAPP